MKKQLFGYTPPEPGTPYVKYINVFDNNDGSIEVMIRDVDCKHVSINLPRTAIEELRDILIKHTGE
jgi:hypothetical protein